MGYEPLHLDRSSERGQLESADNKRDRLPRQGRRQGSSTVSSVIDDGSIDDGKELEKGDQLVQLDDSGLREQLKQDRTACIVPGRRRCSSTRPADMVNYDIRR